MKETKKEIHKGESALMDMGLYVAHPINMNILLTPNEQMVLNVIRHCKNLKERYISNSVFRVNTGLSEGTVRKARDALIELGIIEQAGEPTPLGIEYNVKYNILCNMIKTLNEQKNPIKRLRMVDKFRGEKLSRHTKMIEEFQNSELDIKFKN